MDLGWEETTSDYYNQKVRKIFENIFEELEKDPRKTFLIENVAYLSTYFSELKILDSSVYKARMNRLRQWMAEGRVEMANLSTSAPDEATTYYSDLQQNMVSACRWVREELLDNVDTNTKAQILEKNFKNAWMVDSFGHSFSMAKLLISQGYSSVTWARINGKELEKRRQENRLIFDWILQETGTEKIRIIVLPFHYETFYSFRLLVKFSVNPMSQEFGATV